MGMGFSSERFPRAVLFDFDGVVVNSEPVHWQAWIELGKELGITVSENEVAPFAGLTQREALIAILNLKKPGWTEAEYPVDEICRRKAQLFYRMTQNQLRAYDGVEDFVHWLRSRDVLSLIVTNASRRGLMTGLKLIEMDELFDGWVSRDDVRVGKPSPDPYQLGAALAGFRTSDCLAIEDSPTGLESALTAGVPVAAVMSHFPKSHLEHPVPGRTDLSPIWIGESVAQLFQAIRTTFGDSESPKP